MKKRLRKKLHLKEFQELGFSVYCTYLCKTNEEEEKLIWDFIEMIEDLNLCVGGGYGNNNDMDYFVSYYGRGTVTPTARQQVIDWLENDERITSVKASQLIDAWY